MFISFGQDEPHRSPKEAYFNCVKGIYFLSFFYEHPVFIIIVLCFSRYVNGMLYMIKFCLKIPVL